MPMEPRYIFFNELKIDVNHRFLLKFEESESVKQICFSRRKKHFIANLKVYVKIEIEIEKWNDCDKIVELSKFCQKVIVENEKDIGLYEIDRVTDQRRFTSRIFPIKIQKGI